MKKKDLQQPNTTRQAQNEKGDQRLQNENFVPKPQYIAYPHALRMLEQRGMTKYDLVAAVFYGPESGGLHAYNALTPYEDPLIFSFGIYATRDINKEDVDVKKGEIDVKKEDFDNYFSLLMNCKFLKDDIENFRSVERYIPGHQLFKRWSECLGIDPRSYIASKIIESKLMPFHPVYGLTEASSSEQGRLPPLEAGIFALSEITGIEELEFGGEGTKSRANCDHDLRMQQRANEIAAQLITPHVQKPTKGKVATMLAAELDMAPETVERRIRKQW
jgi:hypothetical protein